MTSAPSKASGTRMQRAIGGGSLRTMQVDDRTRIADLYQHANAKIRVPKQHRPALDAVLINTAGGLTGGDKLDWSFESGARTETIISTQACERIYRATFGAAQVSTDIKVHNNAHLLWLPQETILFDGASLDRRFEADIDPTGRLTALEIIVLGREAMREDVRTVSIIDRWSITSANSMIHADAIRINDETIPNLTQAAHLSDHRVFGTLIDVQPGRKPMDKQERLAFLEQINRLGSADETVNFGASVFEKKTVVRFTARTSYDLRQRLPDLLKEIVPAYTLPTVWRL